MSRDREKRLKKPTRLYTPNTKISLIVTNQFDDVDLITFSQLSLVERIALDYNYYEYLLKKKRTKLQFGEIKSEPNKFKQHSF
jgi:hypothetical protein